MFPGTTQTNSATPQPALSNEVLENAKTTPVSSKRRKEIRGNICTLLLLAQEELSLLPERLKLNEYEQRYLQNICGVLTQASEAFKAFNQLHTVIGAIAAGLALSDIKTQLSLYFQELRFQNNYNFTPDHGRTLRCRPLIHMLVNYRILVIIAILNSHPDYLLKNTINTTPGETRIADHFKSAITDENHLEIPYPPDTDTKNHRPTAIRRIEYLMRIITSNFVDFAVPLNTFHASEVYTLSNRAKNVLLPQIVAFHASAENGSLAPIPLTQIWAWIHNYDISDTQTQDRESLRTYTQGDLEKLYSGEITFLGDPSVFFKTLIEKGIEHFDWPGEPCWNARYQLLLASSKEHLQQPVWGGLHLNDPLCEEHPPTRYTVTAARQAAGSTLSDADYGTPASLSSPKVEEASEHNSSPSSVFATPMGSPARRLSISIPLPGDASTSSALPSMTSERSSLSSTSWENIYQTWLKQLTQILKIASAATRQYLDPQRNYISAVLQLPQDPEQKLLVKLISLAQHGQSDTSLLVKTALLTLLFFNNNIFISDEYKNISFALYNSIVQSQPDATANKIHRSLSRSLNSFVFLQVEMLGILKPLQNTSPPHYKQIVSELSQIFSTLPEYLITIQNLLDPKCRMLPADMYLQPGLQTLQKKVEEKLDAIHAPVASPVSTIVWQPTQTPSIHADAASSASTLSHEL